MSITALVRKALYTSGYNLGRAAIKNQYSREGYFAMAKVLARVMPHFVDNYRTGDISLKIAAGAGLNYELDARTAIVLGADPTSIARIAFLRKTAQHNQEHFYVASLLLQRSCSWLTLEIVGYPSIFRRSIPHLRDFGITTLSLDPYHCLVNKEAGTILSSLTKLVPVIARCMELTDPEDFLFTFQESFGSVLSLTAYSEFFWQLKETLENSPPSRRQKTCEAARLLYRSFHCGVTLIHIREMFAAFSNAASTVPETAHEAWLSYIFGLNSELFKDGNYSKGVPPIAPVDVARVTEDFNRVFNLTEIAWEGIRYRIVGFSPLDSKGKSDAIRVETQNETGETKIFLIKRGDMSSDRLMLKLAAALGLHTYGVEKAPIAGEHQWWAIEYLPNKSIAFSMRYPRSSTDWNMCCDLLEFFNCPQYVREMGQIFAFEYLFDVWDCKMKHILLDTEAKRLFRIDWEFIFGDTKHYGRVTTASEENAFLEEVRSRGVPDNWIAELQTAFLVSFERARGAWPQLQIILREEGVSEDNISKVAARLQSDPIEVLKERFSSIFTKSSVPLPAAY